MRSHRLVLLCAAALCLVLLPWPALAQDETNATEPGAKGTTMQGYTFRSDVSQHARIDLDQKQMEEDTDNARWSDAEAIYSQGKNSKKENSKRTLAGFSTGSSKMSNEGYFRLYQNFWDNKPDYGNRFVVSGLRGNGVVEGKSNPFRAEIANKGSQYLNVWMYVIHELEDAINDCKGGDITNNDAGVEAWDEGFAFYTGSLGATGSGVQGYLLWSLAQKRCGQFGTCASVGGEQIARVNSRVKGLFVTGQEQVSSGQCDAAVKTKNEIVRLMTVPLVQGVIRYVFATKDAKENEQQRGNLEKNHAEGWVFSAAVLPLVHHCDSGVADLLIRNFHPENEPMRDSAEKVIRELSSVYKCLGFSCTDVGIDGERKDHPKCEERGPDFKAVVGTENPASSNNAETFKDYKGINPAGDDGGGISGGAIAGIIIGVLAVAAAIGFFFFWRKSKSKKMQQPIQAESGSSGGGPGEVFG